MTVYVDSARNRLGRMRMAHMTADGLDELHAMAAAVGLRRDWFQKGRYAHYDLCARNRTRAIAAGAVVVDSRELARRARALTEKMKDGA